MPRHYYTIRHPRGFANEWEITAHTTAESANKAIRDSRALEAARQTRAITRDQALKTLAIGKAARGRGAPALELLREIIAISEAAGC